MLRVKDIMTTKLITLAPETDVAHAAKILLENHINGAPVVDGAGRLLGILCQSDLICQQKKLRIPSFFNILDAFVPAPYATQLEREMQKIKAATVAEAMTPNPVTLGPQTGIQETAALMVDNNFHTLPVVEGGRLVGIVGKEDLLRTIASGRHAEADAGITPEQG
jgi:CBS domain-containing protein